MPMVVRLMSTMGLGQLWWCCQCRLGRTKIGAHHWCGASGRWIHGLRIPLCMWAHCLLHKELAEAKFPGFTSSSWKGAADGAAGGNMGFTQAVETTLVLITHREGAWA